VSWGLAEADFSEIVRRCSGRSPCGATRILVEVTPEWDGRKAAAHLKKYSVGGLDFEMQRPLFLDLLATTFPDPAHLLSEHREIPVLQFVAHCERGRRGSLALAWQRRREENSMKKKPVMARCGDELREEYDLSQLKDAVRGKYYGQAIDGEVPNRALPILVEAARTAGSSKRGHSQ
jgi:uncharacterized DUF497 family protein